MTHQKCKRFIMKGAMLLAMLCMLVGGVTGRALATVSMEAESGNVPNFSFDYREMLTAPQAVDTGDGVYYVPTAYVYYGRRYDSTNGGYVPLLNRVLDPTKDNAGGSGAIFLLAEGTVNSSKFSPYSDDFVAENVNDENAYIKSALLHKLYSGAYTAYEISYVNTSTQESLPQELDYIRPITKEDITAGMNGYFGFTRGEGEYFWSVVNGEGQEVESLALLQNAKVFPLSAEELYRYVGTASFTTPSAQALFIARDTFDGTPGSWWLRTALGDGTHTGEMVGSVDPNGKVTYAPAKNTLANRNAFNIETADIAFVERVADNTYRLAFKAPEYKEGAPLEATLTDVKGNLVTFTVKQHIGHNGWSAAGENRISYVITDAEGNEKYYGTAGKVRTLSALGERVAEEETFTLTLPACYTQGDKVQVFWERVDDPDRISTSYVSNFVDLGCIHIPGEGSEANCVSAATCAICYRPYGKPDTNNHESVVDVWTHNEGESTHSKECLQCGVKVYTEPCGFGYHNSPTPTVCYESSCNGCGHKVDHPSLHSYNEKGICTYTSGEYHYEMPELEAYLNMGFETRIRTVGEWNALALWLNNGGYFTNGVHEDKTVFIEADLDFEGVPFIPLGTEERPVQNLNLLAAHHMIENIEYTATDSAPAGMIAAGKNIRVENLILRDSEFSGTDVGSIVGRLLDEADNTSTFSSIAVTNVDLYGANAGGVVGTSTAKASLSLSFIFDVTYSYADVDFSADGNLIPTPAAVNNGVPYGGCYRLADEGDGEFAFTYEAFASGEITYRLRQVNPYWKQNLGEVGHRHPVYCEDESVKRVYRVVSCDGADVFYSNENLGQIQHGEYIGFDPSTFEWVDGIGDFGVGFKVEAICGICQKPTEVTLAADWRVYYSSGVTVDGIQKRFIARMEFDAYIQIDGYRTKVSPEPKVVYSTKLENMIGMTPLTVAYNGSDYYAELLFTNLREGITLKDFDAYFIDPATGERIANIQYDYYGKPVEYPMGVTKVGTYDVLIVGQGGFAGYEYLYEDVFTIKKATVTVNPLDVQKIYDGNGKFEVEYELGGDVVWGLELDISLATAPAAEIGEYTLGVELDLTSHGHGDQLEVVLLRDTVTALILPDLHLSISNKSYPTAITYGDPIPAVTAAHFHLSAAADILYQWFTAEYRYWEEKYVPICAVDTPVDAGTYVLRVWAVSQNGNLIGDSVDVGFEIAKRSLTVDIYAPDGVDVKTEYGSTYYVFDVGEAFRYEVSGFVNGESFASLGMEMSIYLRSANYGSVEGSNNGNPQIPLEDNYKVEYNLAHPHKNYEIGKFVLHVGNTTEESEYGTYDVSVRSPGYVYPVETDFTADGEAISPNILISVAPPVGLAPDGSAFDYTIQVFGPSGQKILEKDSEATTFDLVYLYNHTYTEDYYTSTRGLFAAEGDYRVTVAVNGAGMNASYETTFTLQFFNSLGEGVSKMVEPGLYTVKVTNQNGATYEASLYAKQKLTMELKPHEYSISEGRVEYDPTKVVTEAGNVVHLDHTLLEVYFEVNENYGKIYAVGVKVVDQNGNDVSRLYSLEPNRSQGHSGMNLCHIFDTPCDYDCNIEGCHYVRAVSHTGGTATCLEQAICQNCQSPYGELSADRHIADDVIVYPNEHALDESHLLVYACCGKTKEVVPHTPITPATCTSRAVCAECGWEYGELDPTNHSSDRVTYTQNGETHKVTHHCCGAVDTEDHSGGTAYCNAKAVCTLCGGAYGEINPENHAEQLQYIPDETDPTRHKEYYACCGKTTFYAHVGGDATCIAKAVCEDCHAAYGELEPSDHASDTFAYRQDMDNPSLHTVHHACCDLLVGKDYHEGGEANCLSPALCAFCGTPYGEKNYRHHASEEYSYYIDPENADLHIKVAACCGEFASKEAHTYSDPTCLHAARCACGAENGEPVAHTYDNDCDAVCNSCGEQTRAAAFHQGKDGKPCEICGELIPKEPLSGGGISAIATASTLVASAGGFSLFWFVIKKKSLAELLGILLK